MSAPEGVCLDPPAAVCADVCDECWHSLAPTHSVGVRCGVSDWQSRPGLQGAAVPSMLLQFERSMRQASTVVWWRPPGRGACVHVAAPPACRVAQPRPHGSKHQAGVKTCVCALCACAAWGLRVHGWVPPNIWKLLCGVVAAAKAHIARAGPSLQVRSVQQCCQPAVPGMQLFAGGMILHTAGCGLGPTLVEGVVWTRVCTYISVCAGSCAQGVGQAVPAWTCMQHRPLCMLRRRPRLEGQGYWCTLTR